MLKSDLPTPVVGMPVWWYHAGNKHEKPQAALILEVGIESCTVGIFSPNIRGMLLRENVRHLAAPHTRGQESDMQDAGCWDVTKEWKELQALKQAIANMIVEREQSRSSSGVQLRSAMEAEMQMPNKLPELVQSGSIIRPESRKAS